MKQFPCPLSPSGLCEHGGVKPYDYGFVRGTRSFCRHKKQRRPLDAAGFKCPKINESKTMTILPQNKGCNALPFALPKADAPNFTDATARKSCDTCASQEGRHYCLLHGIQVKNMDAVRCEDWSDRDCPRCGGEGIVYPHRGDEQDPCAGNYPCPNCAEDSP